MIPLESRLQEAGHETSRYITSMAGRQLKPHLRVGHSETELGSIK